METIISGAAVIIVAIIELIAAKERKRNKEDKEKAERRAELRARESRIGMKMMDASLDLSLACSLAIEQCKINGEMANAKKKAEDAQTEYQEFLREVTAKEIAKV